MKQDVGWREWLSLSALNTPWIKAKIDTGARSSSLHADEIEIKQGPEGELVRFSISPWQGSALDTVRVQARVLEWRAVRSSSGEAERRPTIVTTIRIGDQELDIEFNLTQRDQIGFRMLVGREALGGRFLVDSGKSYLGPKPPKPVRSRNRESDKEE